MPIFALILIALAAGALVAFVASRYPTPVVGEAPADAAAVTIEAEMERHPWLLRLVRDRLDPGYRHRARPHNRSRVGDPGRNPDRPPRLPRQEQRYPRRRRRACRAMGSRQRHQLVDRRVAVRHRARRNVCGHRRADHRLGSRVPACPEQVGARLPGDRRRRRDPPREHGQGAPRPGAPDLQSHRRDAGAIVPERPLRVGGGVLRSSGPRPRTPTRHRPRAH